MKTHRWQRPHQQKLLQKLLRDLRTERGHRQADAAAAIGIAQSAVSKYETGERRLDILEIRALCQLFGISLSEFVAILEEKLRDIEK